MHCLIPRMVACIPRKLRLSVFLLPLLSCENRPSQLPSLTTLRPHCSISSPPTSQDCILRVISRANNDEWELNLLRHGAEEWTKHNYSSKPYKIDAIKGAAYHKEGREFYFYDPKPHPKGLVFSTDNLNVQYYQIVRNGLGTSTLPFDYCKDYFVTENLKNKLELAENVSISTCGIQMEIGGRIICGESITADGVTDQSSSRQLKGVWIHPRFYQVSSNNQS